MLCIILVLYECYIAIVCCVTNNEYTCQKIEWFYFLLQNYVEGCRSVSLPTEAANQDVQDDLYKEFEKKYKIRQHIVPQVFQKAKIKK